jgi:hypothetical protein
MGKRSNKKIKVAVIAILTITFLASFHFTEPSIFYSAQPHALTRIDNQWYTRSNGINSQGSFITIDVTNRGLFDGAFYVIISLKNATFTEKPFEMAEIVDSHQLKLPFTLHGLQKTTSTVYFTIDNSVVGNFTPGHRTPTFEISISFEPNQLFIRSTEANWGGQSRFTYGQSENDTWIPPMIS